MKRVLLTGMSGVGKSTLTATLAARGYKAVDTDTDEFSEWETVASDTDQYGSPVEPGRDWVWREDRIRALLSAEDTDIVFVSGSAANMQPFLSQFDHIILLSAPVGVIVERLRTRTNNPYGKHPDEVARVLELIAIVEPLLRRIAGYEIDTSGPIDDIVTAILGIVEARPNTRRMGGG